MPFLALGELSLLADGPNGKQEAAQAAKALMAVGFATEVLKFTVREKRPDSTSRSSFPSGHTSAAFAMATMLADYKPKYAFPAYGVATAIAWSRLDQHEHHLQDVIAGAALGYFTAKRFTGNHVTVSPYGVGYNWKM
jgi:membrane-associated phospholipid phosphatase